MPIARVSVGEKGKKKEKRVKGERFRVPDNELGAVKRRAKRGGTPRAAGRQAGRQAEAKAGAERERRRDARRGEGKLVGGGAGGGLPWL